MNPDSGANPFPEIGSLVLGLSTWLPEKPVENEVPKPQRIAGIIETRQCRENCKVIEHGHVSGQGNVGHESRLNQTANAHQQQRHTRKEPEKFPSNNPESGQQHKPARVDLNKQV
mmetsp:Transcript_1470/g.3401  ORF Transcript_1470/g.3401 Transcript_1470/m.3401 type:complete len:115 (+) Transcript_1470:3417-3761(+)